MRYTISLAVLAAVLAMAGCNQQNKGPDPVPPAAPPAAQNSPRSLDSMTPTPPPPSPSRTEAAMASSELSKPTPLVPGGKTYTIQKGDTLFSIAKKTMGDGKRWVDIKAANPGLNEKTLAVGKTINIPEK